MKQPSRLDHIVVGAETLADGVSYLENLLGVKIPFGGEHVQMGTHNHLMQLGNEVFLEVIAINQQAPPPHRPRWYGLDDPYIRARLKQQPLLLTWVVNTLDINNLLKRATFSAGSPELISRGDLRWKFGLPDDGRLLAAGLLPYAIEWHTDTHPAHAMADPGCRIRSLDIYHPYPDWLRTALESINALPLVQIHALASKDDAFFTVSIESPQGMVELQSYCARTVAPQESARQNLCYCERALMVRFYRSFALRMNNYAP